VIRSECLQLGVIAGVAAAIISHPADTLLSKVNKAGAGGMNLTDDDIPLCFVRVVRISYGCKVNSYFLLSLFHRYLMII
jgi:hypothetical protein